MNKGNLIPLVADPDANEITEIADRAFEVWLAREFRNGSPAEDLIQAMLEVRARKSTKRITAPQSRSQRQTWKGAAKVVAIR